MNRMHLYHGPLTYEQECARLMEHRLCLTRQDVLYLALSFNKEDVLKKILDTSTYKYERIDIALHKHHLDILMSDPDPLVRCAVAYSCDEDIKEKLRYDPDYRVRAIVEDYFNKKEAN